MNLKIKKFYYIFIFLIILYFLILLLYFSDKLIQYQTLDELCRWIHQTIKYKSDGDYKGSDFWQLPEETLKLKTGDCEDVSILFMFLAKRDLNIDVEMIWIVSIEKRLSHMVCRYNHIIYDPQLSISCFEKIFISDKLIWKTFNQKKLDEEIYYYRKVKK